MKKVEDHLDRLIQETMGDFQAETNARKTMWGIYHLLGPHAVTDLR
jgi:hypothetical protein